MVLWSGQIRKFREHPDIAQWLLMSPEVIVRSSDQAQIVITVTIHNQANCSGRLMSLISGNSTIPMRLFTMTMFLSQVVMERGVSCLNLRSPEKRSFLKLSGNLR